MSEDPLADRVETASAAGGAPPATPGSSPARAVPESEVRAWVSRFVDPERPLRIGSLAARPEGRSDPAAAAGSFEEGAAGSTLDLVAGSRGPGSRSSRHKGRGPLRRARVAEEGRARGRRERFAKRSGRGPASGLVAAVALLATGGILTMLTRNFERAPTDARTATPAAHRETGEGLAGAQGPARSVAPSAAPRMRGASRASRPAVSAVSSPAVPPVSGPGAATVSKPASAAARPASRPAPAVGYGLEVATYINPERAAAERRDLADRTGLSSRLLIEDDGGGATYRIMLGPFETRRAAVRSAEDLLARGLVRQARVVALVDSGRPR